MPRLYDPPEQRPLADLGIATSNPHAVAVMCEQGSQDWHAARIGRATGSRASCVVTPTGRAVTGAARASYACELIAERLTGTIEAHFVTAAMERGTALEPRAREWYELQTGRAVQQVGFVYADASRDVGASPDGLCADRCLEIKCLMRKNHIAALLDGGVPKDYVPQCQFEMWACGLSALDFVLYTPEPQIPSAIWTMEADAKLHAAFDEHVPAFCAEVEAATRKLETQREGDYGTMRNAGGGQIPR